jgi:hypothetical protein
MYTPWNACTELRGCRQVQSSRMSPTSMLTAINLHKPASVLVHSVEPLAHCQVGVGDAAHSTQQHAHNVEGAARHQESGLGLNEVVHAADGCEGHRLLG